MEYVRPPKNWSTSHSGGRRIIVKEDAKLTPHQKRGREVLE